MKRPLTPTSRWSRTIAIGGLTCTLLLGAMAKPSAAQPTGERRELIEELLKSLIEAELEKRDTHTVRKISATSSTPPISTASSSSDLRAVRDLLDQFSEESSRLAFALDAESSKNSHIKNHLTAALKVRARSAVVAQKSRRSTRLSEIAEDYTSLDRDWRSLAHELSEVRDMSSRTSGYVENMNKFDRQLCELLEIKPQLDQRKLIRQVETLTADMRVLVEDIELELGRQGNAQELLMAARKAQHQSVHVSNAVLDKEDYDHIVAEYKTFQTLWTALSAKLWEIDNRYLERSMRRIQTADQSLQEVLWITQDLNRPQLIHTTKQLMDDVDEFFARTPLKLLIALPDSYSVLSISDEFFGVCENLNDIVARNETQESIIEAYRYVDEAGVAFLDVFRPLKSQAAQSVLKDIEGQLASLRESLHVHDSFDRRAAADLAASLELLADQLELDVNRWLSRSRVSFSATAKKATRDFALDTRDLHEELLSGTSTENLRKSVSDLYDSWRTVYGYIARSEDTDRARLARAASSITPKLVELHTLLE